MANQYDLVVLGGGTAGYAAAIKASRAGLKTAIVEKSKLGGTCLHKGCIPTKSFLKSAETLAMMRSAGDFGIDNVNPTFDMKNIVARKDQVVSQMHNGIRQLMKKHKVDVFEGHGRILGPSLFSPMAGTVAVDNPHDDEGESEILVNQNVLICTGSRPRELPFLPFDGAMILSSDDMMVLEEVPDRIAIIGGGIIGLEFASMLNDLGAKVTVYEAGERLLPNEDRDLSNTLKKYLEEKGILFELSAELNENNVILESDAVKFKAGEEQIYDKVLVAIGRSPNIEDIGLASTRIELKDGYIRTNEYYQTKDDNIYAVGDCIGNLQLAHVATKEALNAITHMTDEEPFKLDYNQVPRCIYTSPEAASIGMTEDELKAEDITFEVHKIPLNTVAKAVIEGDKNGFGKILTEPDTGDILGASLVGPNVTELINEVSLAKFLDASALELGSSIHAHPSVSEILMELGLDAEGMAIHV
ncbi:dihydrolipoyl dehydrogenase [Lacicoccus alkaliphilus]|uniref:Dihydrolipoyl dehydrogenase n=1 Tax=Lacicoccus alkaliphilus DSM 16010 TaxID=1123231 RepID=A0A1M7BF46_9BACL|nr:dihydrolipoyl dehydrogenase [Salinicoccus alkaliphilus]SHL53534.1 dihydrolipoamide dehydrogenase [Salinicoccus alkaliphilus DSM 16010]